MPIAVRREKSYHHPLKVGKIIVAEREIQVETTWAGIQVSIHD